MYLAITEETLLNFLAKKKHYLIISRLVNKMVVNTERTVATWYLQKSCTHHIILQLGFPKCQLGVSSFKQHEGSIEEKPPRPRGTRACGPAPSADTSVPRRGGPRASRQQGDNESPAWRGPHATRQPRAGPAEATRAPCGRRVGAQR